MAKGFAEIYIKVFPRAKVWIIHGFGRPACYLEVYARQNTDTECLLTWKKIKECKPVYVR